MLSVALIVVGAAVAAWLAVPGYEVGMGGGQLAALAAAAAQIGVAAVVALRVPGAWMAAIAVLVVHVLVLALAGLLLLVFVALPSAGGGPLPGHAFNPVALGAIVTAAVGLTLLYVLGFRSARSAADRLR